MLNINFVIIILLYNNYVLLFKLILFIKNIIYAILETISYTLIICYAHVYIPCYTFLDLCCMILCTFYCNVCTRL